MKNQLFAKTLANLQGLEVEERNALLVTWILPILEMEDYKFLHEFIDELPMCDYDELVYRLAYHIYRIDSKTLLEKQSDRFSKFMEFVERADPEKHLHSWRACSLLYRSTEGYIDLSSIAGKMEFDAEAPSGIFSGWGKRLLTFTVRGDENEISDYIFNDAFVERFMKRVIPELRSMETSHGIDDEWDKEAKGGMLEVAVYMAEIVDFLSSRQNRIIRQFNGVGIFAVPRDNEGLEYTTEFLRLREASLFFYTLNPEQFMGALKGTKLVHTVQPFIEHYTKGEGKEYLESKAWYRSMKGIPELAFKNV